MKKTTLLVLMLLCNIVMTSAQDSIVYNITSCPELMRLCLPAGPKVIIYAQQGCTDFYWSGGGVPVHGNPIIIDPQIDTYWQFNYHGCNGFYKGVVIEYANSPTPSSFTHTLWKHQGEVVQLEAVGQDSIDWPYYYTFQWNTGETTRTIETVESDTLTCVITGLCGSATRKFIVRDNVEITLATCDLESNLNTVTWQTTPAQAEYIDHVIIKRDGMQVGTANYSDGQFIDNIGSGAASRTYTITAVATDGTQCPIVSYPKETIHMAYLTGINNTIEVNWNIPTGYDLLGYNICEWHEDDGSLSVIDFVGASVTSYTCSESQFDEGYIVVQGVEAGKDGETRLLSNRSMDLVGIGENEATAFKVYPNPANGILFVETRRATSLPMETYRIVNPIGQTIMKGQITMEKQQISVRDLPKGVYFIIVGSATRKFVVE